MATPSRSRVATSGKAVTFSGLAVAIGLGGLLVFSAPALRSFGIGGMLTVLASLFYALTFLPALLGILGPRVELAVRSGLIDRVRRALRPSRPRGGAAASASRWEWIANTVMAHPIVVIVPTLSLLLLAGLPFLRLEQGIPDAYTSAARASRAATRPSRSSPASRPADRPDHRPGRRPRRPARPGERRALAAYGERPGRASRRRPRREPVHRHPNPATGQPLHHRRAGRPVRPAARAAWPPPLARAVGPLRRRIHRPLRRHQPAPALLAGRHRGRCRARALDPGDGITAMVGGQAARPGTTSSSRRPNASRTPWASVLLAMFVVLFLLFGSVVLPVKAILMTLLSITASFGAMVWIFQDGNLQRPLGFTSPGFTIAGNPIIMFSVLFGLSMDYEVLLLSRVQEAYRRSRRQPRRRGRGPVEDGRRHHRRGRDHGPVFAAFALADTITIKSIGVGMAIAVFARRDDRPDPAGAGDDAAAGQVELVGAGPAGPVRRPARLQPRRGRRRYRRATRPRGRRCLRPAAPRPA